jgi:hypothetical protein
MFWRFMAALFLLAALPARADDGYLRELVDRARQLRLADDPEWHRLLHYQPRRFGGGVESLNDDAAFFNSPRGKHDPGAELAATLAAFFVAGPETDREQPAQCRFVARYAWLKEKLAFDPARLPEAPCRRFREFRAALDPQGATLIFAAAFLNNPASMFGHTLLRLDRRGQDERTRLLAPTLNYAAHATDPLGLRYAWKGLTGGYPGRFTVSPYFVKVRDYNDLEHRDLWEYRLNLTPAELDRLVHHLWELMPSYFDYFFFDENCSYHLLALLEVARPGLRLTDRFNAWTIPSDTVHAVARTPGLVSEVIYRPSTASVLRDRMQRLTADDRRRVRALAQGPEPRDADARPPAPDESAAVLDAATALVAYRQERRFIPAAEGERLASALLLARARVDAAGPPPPVPAPGTRPDHGHGSARVGASVGRERARGYAELEWRAGYHDVLDDARGFEPGAQIEVLRIAVRRREHGQARLQALELLDVLSLPARDEHIRTWAWRLQAGWRRETLPDGAEPLVFRWRMGAGLTFGGARSNPYVMLEGAIKADPRFQPDWLAGAGPAIGWIAEPVSGWRVHAFARRLRFTDGPRHDDREAMLATQVDAGRRQGWRLEAGRRALFDRGGRVAALQWHRYY